MERFQCLSMLLLHARKSKQNLVHLKWIPKVFFHICVHSKSTKRLIVLIVMFFILLVDDSDSRGDTEVISEVPIPSNSMQTIFGIRFEVPYGSATQDLELQSNIA